MPLLQIKSFGHSALGIWKMSETAGELLSCPGLSEQGKAELDQIASLHRRREFLAVRNLLREMTGGIPDIAHTAEGQPFMKGDHRHISITHSRSLVAILLSEFPAGIDTEEADRKVAGIARRFLSVEEMEWTLKASRVESAQLFCWSCKESAYKMLGIPGIDFRLNLAVAPLIIGEEGTARVIHRADRDETVIAMNYFFAGNNIVTWCVNNKGNSKSPI